MNLGTPRNGASLQQILTIPQAARMFKITRSRMHRILTTANEQLDGMLLKNIGTKTRPRWTVTLGALKQIAPEWFRDPESLQREQERQEEEITALQKEVVHLRELNTRQTALIVSQNETIKRISERLKRLEERRAA